MIYKIYLNKAVKERIKILSKTTGGGGIKVKIEEDTILPPFQHPHII